MLVVEGYAGLSMRKIASAIGYSATSIYLHYPGKDELVHALIREGFRLLSRKIQGVLTTGDSAVESLNKLCHAYVEFGLENPGYYEIMFSLHPVSMTSFPVSDYRDARGILTVVERVIRAGESEGVFMIEDPFLAANVLWFQLHGAVSLILASRTDVSIDKSRLADSTVRTAVRALMSDRLESPKS